MSMFSFSKRSATPTNSDFEHSVMPSAANSSKAEIDIQRELVRVAFKDTLRATGVPAQWLDCEVSYIPAGDQIERVQVQFIVKQWSGHLLRYSMAFQKQVMQCLDRYEPHTDHSKHEWLWKYAADCDMPFPTMPAPSEWAEKLAATYVKKPAVVAKARPVAMPAAASLASALPPAVQSKDFDLRDIFSDLKADKLTSH